MSLQFPTLRSNTPLYVQTVYQQTKTDVTEQLNAAKQLEAASMQYVDTPVHTHMSHRARYIRQNALDLLASLKTLCAQYSIK
jgi:hypothetical protein